MSLYTKAKKFKTREVEDKTREVKTNRLMFTNCSCFRIFLGAKIYLKCHDLLQIRKLFTIT